MLKQVNTYRNVAFVETKERDLITIKNYDSFKETDTEFVFRKKNGYEYHFNKTTIITVVLKTECCIEFIEEKEVKA